jgi:hypothetical protein
MRNPLPLDLGRIECAPFSNSTPLLRLSLVIQPPILLDFSKQVTLKLLRARCLLMANPDSPPPRTIADLILPDPSASSTQSLLLKPRLIVLPSISRAKVVAKSSSYLVPKDNIVSNVMAKKGKKRHSC